MKRLPVVHWSTGSFIVDVAAINIDGHGNSYTRAV